MKTSKEINSLYKSVKIDKATYEIIRKIAFTSYRSIAKTIRMAIDQYTEKK